MSNAAEHTSHAINWWGLGSQYAESPALGWYIVTFLTFSYLLYVAVRKPIALFLEVRANDIRKQIEEAGAAKAESLARYEGCESQLQSLDIEISRLKADFVLQGEREKKLIEETARKLAEQLKRDAEDSIQGETRHALALLKQETIRLAFDLAKIKAAAGATIQADHKLIDSFCQDVSELKH